MGPVSHHAPRLPRLIHVSFTGPVGAGRGVAGFRRPAGPVGTVGGVERFRPLAVSALAAVTLFIWGNRIWLAWTNDEDTLAEKLVWSVPITVFVAAAVVLLAGAASGRRLTDGGLRVAALLLGWGTVAYWAVRAPMISLADHPAGFKIVHGVLALVSVGAASAALRAMRAMRAAPARAASASTGGALRRDTARLP